MVLEMNKSQSSTSLAGTWGEEIRRKTLKHTSDPDAAVRFQTVSKAAFTAEPFQKIRETDPNKYSKFEHLRQNGAVIVNPAAYERTQDASEEIFLDSAMSPFSSHKSFSRTMSRAGTSQSRPESRLSTVTRDSYRPFSRPSPFDVDSSVDMKQTNYRLLRTTDAPIAVGRSGVRQEKGVSTSGLLGERLMLEDEPKRNTLAQKSWLYSEDAALAYKINGVPRAPPVTDRSITLPCELNGDRPQTHSARRLALLTGDLKTRTGRARAGVFLDEFDVR